MRKTNELLVTAETGGDIYNLNSPLSGLLLRQVEGLGQAEVHRLSQRSPFQRGVTDKGFTVEPREISVVWDVQAEDPQDLVVKKRNLYTIFRPRENDPVVLKFYQPDGSVRAIDAYMDGRVDFEARDRHDARTHRVAVILLAEDPRVYHPKQRSLEFALSGDTVGWDIEETGQSTALGWSIEETGQATANGWQIGNSSNLNASEIVTYAQGRKYADIEYPKIRLYGPISSPVIENLTTDESLPFTAQGGLQLSSGEWVEVDLRFGRKSVVDQDGNTLDHYLATDADLATFHLSYNTELLPDGSRSDGDNEIQVTGGNATGDTRVIVYWYARYIGI